MNRRTFLAAAAALPVALLCKASGPPPPPTPPTATAASAPDDEDPVAWTMTINGAVYVGYSGFGPDPCWTYTRARRGSPMPYGGTVTSS